MSIKMRLNLARRQLRLKAKGMRIVGILVGGCMLAATLRELRLPTDERTWHGTLFGWVPYDLRPPTLRRLMETYWNPANSHFVGRTAYGVGWSVNLSALLHQAARPLRA